MENSGKKSTFCEKQAEIKNLFTNCLNQEERYHRIIELGQKQTLLKPEFKIPENLVKGCQSQLFLHSSYQNGVIFFATESDALISQGLAALLVAVYSGETPEIIIQTPPHYLEELGIPASLTPNRASGLYSVHLHMKQAALKFLSQNLD